MRPKLKDHVGEYEYSIGYRLCHWIRFVCIVVLIISGFYIAYVFQSPEISASPTNFMNAKWRFVHVVFGFLLIAVAIFKTYLFFTDKMSRKELVSVLDCFNIKVIIAQIKYYIFMGDHPKLRGVYNPLQFVSYFFFYMVLFVICLTGLILYAHVYHNGLGGLLYNPMMHFEVLLGGLARVREIHHICMWIIIVFVCIHVYMAVFNSVKGVDGCMDAIISGYKFPKED